MSELDAWQPVLADVEVLRESCRVYAVKSPGGTIFVNPGTGGWLDAIPERFLPPFAVLCTHHFRDHAAGAAKASRMGMTVFVPEGELEIFADPVQHFESKCAARRCVYDKVSRKLFALPVRFVVTNTRNRGLVRRLQKLSDAAARFQCNIALLFDKLPRYEFHKWPRHA